MEPTTHADRQARLDCDARITAARVILYRAAPFFAVLASRLKPLPNPLCDTMAVMADGRLIYGPRFVRALPLPQLAACLAHEVLHLAGDAFRRRGNRHPLIWNWAHDFVVNELVTKSGLELPDGVLLDPSLYGWTAEQIYEKIVRDVKFVRVRKCVACRGTGRVPPPSSNRVGDDANATLPLPFPVAAESEPESRECDACAGTGRVLRPDVLGGGRHGCADHLHPDNWRYAQGAYPDDAMTPYDWRSSVFEAAEAARRAGKLPAGIERWIGTLARPRLDWRNVLARTTAGAVGAAATSWRRPSRRSWAAGVYLPGWSHGGRDVTIAVDTSGSITEAELRQFASEADAIMRDAGGHVNVLCCDAEVATEASVTTIRSVQLHGGGGTSFVPVFQRLAERSREKPTRLLVYFTDLLGEFPSQAPPYPVLWCVPEDARAEAPIPPFGTVLWVPHGTAAGAAS